MVFTSRINKLVLTSHITFSVGWLGAVAVFLALAITSLTSNNVQIIRSCYIAMNISAWFIIIPFCLTSLFTGIFQAIFTKWGLFKYYWIVVKLFLTLSTTVLLLLHMEPVGYLSGLAEDPAFSNLQQPAQLITVITQAGAAILVLIALTTISIYKPWGKIKYRFNHKQEESIEYQNNITLTKRTGKVYLLIVLTVLIAFMIIRHLMSMEPH